MKNSILIVREIDQFSRILSKNGFSVISCPTIKTVPLENISEFSAKLEKINDYDGIFLTSAPAAEILRQKFRESNLDFRGKIYVLGKRSFDLLKNEKFDLFFNLSANTAAELLSVIPAADLQGRHFLFVRGEKSIRVVPEFLSGIARVEELPVYRTEKVIVEIDKIKAILKMLKKSEIICACFFSPSGAESFLEQFGEDVLHQTYIATIGKTTAVFFEKRNIKVDFISGKASAENFAIELSKYLKNEVEVHI
ncbi:MAG TPA: uroporphyrinogen-III synthase [Pyrinomonadaceae bacterium]|jgi:uroporphyrinogen III methyltransferase/synthase